jgi:soluble lytic murein transglycosylase-like protein
MTKKSLIAKIFGIGVIASTIAFSSSGNTGKNINYYPSPQLYSQQIVKEKIEPKEYLKKRIIEENLDTGNYAPEKAVEILEKGIRKAGGLSEKIDINFLYSIVANESSWNPREKSSAGAKGLAQITEDTWNDYNPKVSYKEVYNPEENIKAAVKIINGHEQFFAKNHPNWENLGKTERLRIHAAAYNGGRNRIKRINFNLENKKRLPRETRNYIKKVLDTYEKIEKESV